MRGYRGRHRAPRPGARIAVNAARIAVGGLVLAEITGAGFPAVPAYASTPAVLASSHHSTDTVHKHHHKHHPVQVPAARTVAAVHQAVTVAAVEHVASAAPESQPVIAAVSDQQQQQLFDHYIVQPGDTLTHIAAAYGIPWESMWAFNTDQVAHPDSLYPGLRLRLPA